MMSAEAETSSIARAYYYSLWKALLIELAVWSLTIFALVPWTAEGSRFTIFYKDPFLYGFLIICGLYLIFLSLRFLRIVWRAFMGRPAVKIKGDQVCVYGTRFGEFSLSSIARCQTQYGNTIVYTKDGKRIAIPIVILANGGPFAAALSRYCPETA